MSTRYKLSLELPDEDATTVFINASVNGVILPFRFQWAVVSEEQYNLIAQYLTNKANSDPLYVQGSYTYAYDWQSYYMKLSSYTEEELIQWLVEQPDPLPASILKVTPAEQLLILRKRITECKALDPVIRQYKELLRWQFHTFYGDETTVGYIEPGGWYRNQDAKLSFRFISELDYIGRKDFNNVTMEFELYA